MKRRIKIINKCLSALLAVILLFRPGIGVVVLAEGEITEPQPEVTAENSQTGTDTTNTAGALETQEATVNNDNQANVENNLEVDSNTGENTISPEPIPFLESSPTPDPLIEPCGSACPEPSLAPSPLPLLVEPTSSPDLILESPLPSPCGEENPLNSDSSSDTTPLQLTEEIPIEGSVENGVVVENQNTGDNSNNDALALAGEGVVVSNENQATIQNDLVANGITGENTVEGDDSQIETGNAIAGADAVNVVNTNIVGEDFWQLIINQFEDSQGDLDLSNLEGLGVLNAEFISVLVSNLQTGSDSTNFALATLLCLFAVYNDNLATLTNNLDLLASSGGNQIVGEDGTLQTGNADALLNLFNMVNTNLVGSDWFFGVINLFGQLEGDIILPNEWLFLGEDGSGGASTAATNLGTGADSNNQALVGDNNSFNVSNVNNADLTNNVTVLANSGENAIIGDGSIETGDANAQANLLNIVNTNIVGSRWVLLVINNMGEWMGEVLGWWGHLFTIGNTTLAWVQLPLLGDGNAAETAALNSETGDGSDNLALTQSQSSSVVENNNVATVENNIGVTADTGNNQIVGEDGTIQTGNASAIANLFNFLNTNIIGNHWYFCMINIFDRFVGNIRFFREPVDEENNGSNGETPSSAVSSAGNGGSGGSGDGACHDQAPGGAPKLLTAVAGKNSVTLTWEKAPDPVSYYLVAYGVESGVYLYGQPNLGGPETISYTINHLSGGQTYYFVVRAGNGCAPGPFSNELAATPYGAVLTGAAEGFLPGVLGVQAAEGEVGESFSAVESLPSRIIPWWLIFSLSGTSLLAALSRGFYLLFRKS
ncbi:MAG: fibronectin type III domain-containing protein [Candidatus Marinimicrobia bacterium]|nr:fibronectin type III domain-containing protein [Candidatus Neomarinimicrobiota bacterium]